MVGKTDSEDSHRSLSGCWILLGATITLVRRINDSWEGRNFVPDRAQFRLDSTVYFESKKHIEMVLLNDRLYVVGQILDKVLNNAAHLGIKGDLLELGLKLLV